MRSKAVALIAIIFIIFLFGFWMSQLAGPVSFRWESKKMEAVDSEAQILINCKNLNLEDTSACLTNNVKPIFKYNITDDDLILTFETLKENGGDCKNYALLYERLGKELGFNSYFHVIVLNETKKHAFTTISNEEGFCVLNFVSARCYVKKIE